MSGYYGLLGGVDRFLCLTPENIPRGFFCGGGHSNDIPVFLGDFLKKGVKHRNIEKTLALYLRIPPPRIVYDSQRRHRRNHHGFSQYNIFLRL